MKHLLTLALVLCLGTFASAQIPNFTKIGPNIGFINIIKRANGNFVASANQDVFEFTGLNGSFNSLNFTSQVGTLRDISELLGENNSNQLFRGTADDGIYKYANGQWAFNALSGFGTGGQFWNKLSNGRLIFSKGGFLRNIYYSDNDGSNWIASNVGNVDWNHLIVSNTGNLFAVSRYGQSGLIKSTNNGTNWNYINSNVPLNTANCIFSNGQSLFVIADNSSIKKSSDDGLTWTNFSVTPNNEDGGGFIQFDKYFFLTTYSNGPKFYYSDTSTINWIDITSQLQPNLAYINSLKVLNQTLFVATTNGLFYSQGGNVAAKDINSTSIQVYPNPSNHDITLQVLPQHLGKTITLVNALGQHVLQTQLQNERQTLSLEALPAGVYTAFLNDERRTTVKLIKE